MSCYLRAGMTAPRFVILSSGRAGSGYIAKVLNFAGCACGHEGFWNANAEGRLGTLIGDSSWFALVPGALDGWRGKVFHQTRHPLAVVSSFVHAPPDRRARSWPYKVRTLLREVPSDPLELAMALWHDSNVRAEEMTDRRWGVEDVSPMLVSLLVLLGSGMSVTTCDEETAAAAIAAVPKNHNQHTDKQRLGWDDLPAGALKDDVRAMGERYGYVDGP